MSAMASDALARPYRTPGLRPDADVTRLPPRAVQVARHIAGGFTEKEIGFLLGVSRSIVARERQRFVIETGALTLREIVLACRAHGLEPA